MNMRFTWGLLMCIYLAPQVLCAASCYHSKFWDGGAQLNGQIRIPDVSRAGYMQGDSQIPNLSSSRAGWFDVKTFGAKGDAKASGNLWKGSDDYAAVMKAINTLKPGSVLYFPPGNYMLSRDLKITKPISLKGAGVGKTVLYFANSMTDIYGPMDGKDREWQYGPGFIAYNGGYNKPRIALITASAAKGARSVSVDDTSKIKPGMWVMVSATDKGGALIQALYGGYKDNLGQTINRLVGVEAITFYAKVASVNSAQKTVQLDRELLHALDVKLYGTISLKAINPKIQNAGVDDLTVRLKPVPYVGHHKEVGLGGIYLTSCFNMWIRNVEILNSDNAINLGDTHFSTVSNVVVRDDVKHPKNYMITGHHAFWLSSRSSNNLVTDFTVVKQTFHDMCVEFLAHLNVYKNGRGTDMNMDHHCGAPNSNLYSNIHLGAGIRGFKSGGPDGQGQHAGIGSTFWNLRADKPINLPAPTWGAGLTIIGTPLSSGMNSTYKYGWQVESAANLCFPDLHAAMKQNRIQNKQ